jgi:hypothetical protein
MRWDWEAKTEMPIVHSKPTMCCLCATAPISEINFIEISLLWAAAGAVVELFQKVSHVCSIWSYQGGVRIALYSCAEPDVLYICNLKSLCVYGSEPQAD